MRGETRDVGYDFPLFEAVVYIFCLFLWLCEFQFLSDTLLTWGKMIV